MTFTGSEKVFCVLEYTRSQSNKTVQHAFVREFSKQSPTAMQTWYGTKHSKRKVVCAGEKKERKRMCCVRECVHENILQSPNKSLRRTSLETHSNNNSLAQPEEALDNETLQATTQSDDIGRGQAKAETELTCDVSQAY